MPVAPSELSTEWPEPTQVAADPATPLLALVEELARELRVPEAALAALSLDSRLDRDLGLDSLARAELLQRIGRTFAIAPDERMLLAETPRGLLGLIRQARDGRVLSGAGTGPEAAVTVSSYPGPAESTESATTGPPDQVATLNAMLEWRARWSPDRIAVQLPGADEQITRRFTYAELWHGARTVAAGLQARGLQPRQTVALMLPTGADYFLGFFGALLAGGIPVPIYPPARPAQIEEHLRRHIRLLNNAQVVALITVPEARRLAWLLQAQVETLRQVATVAELNQPEATWRAVTVAGADLAFLQYTSGSTGDPKGVMLTHANLLANLRAMGRHIGASAEDVFVSWLPLYHDMGLIGACLGSLYYACPLTVLSPLSFLARPARWLWAIHQQRGTLSAAPNFAYELCARTIPDHELTGLDLSSWRMALNGAEPVSPATLERFTARFQPYGFRPEAMAPVYGLAECSVGLTLQRPGRGVRLDRIRREPFMTAGQAEPAGVGDETALQFPSCGQPLAGHEVRIADHQGRELPERREGQVEFRGPSATAGYYRHPEATRRLFPHDDAWLDSGDRGYLADGELYLTGRVKDLIIRGGRNFYPYELEQAIGEITGVRKGCVAVFASPDPASGSERLVVVAETRTAATEERTRLRQAIQNVSVDVLGAPPDDVALVPPHTVLKTSSGKLRRAAVRELYENQRLSGGARAVWLQLARLALSSAGARLARWGRDLAAWGHAIRAWLAYGLLAPAVWLGILLLPRLEWRWRLARRGARWLAGLSGVALDIQGLEQIPAGPCVVVANHASFLDAYVLIAVLPRPFAYVAKRELQANRWLARPLARMGTLFVERFDAQRGVEEARQLVEAARAGRDLAFFPEGTFTRMAGLRSFRMGAFLTAAQAGVPIVPVVIRGTRAMLRAGSWLPRLGLVEVMVTPPLQPDGADWAAAVRLRDAARAAILSQVQEPDLGEQF